MPTATSSGSSLGSLSCKSILNTLALGAGLAGCVLSFAGVLLPSAVVPGMLSGFKRGLLPVAG